MPCSSFAKVYARSVLSVTESEPGLSVRMRMPPLMARRPSFVFAIHSEKLSHERRGNHTRSPDGSLSNWMRGSSANRIARLVTVVVTSSDQCGNGHVMSLLLNVLMKIENELMMTCSTAAASDSARLMSGWFSFTTLRSRHAVVLETSTAARAALI